jgi:hypothetical protein
VPHPAFGSPPAARGAWTVRQEPRPHHPERFLAAVHQRTFRAAFSARPLGIPLEDHVDTSCRVECIKVGRQQLLLAYQFDPKRNAIEVLDVGPHENFYRELQKDLDAR